MKKAASLFVLCVLSGILVPLGIGQSVTQHTSSASLEAAASSVPVKTVRKISVAPAAPKVARKVAVKPSRRVSSSSSSSSVAPIAEAPAPVAPARTDRLYALDDVQMEDRHRTMAKAILGLLPLDCQEKLESFTVRYDNPTNRGLAGRGVMILSGNVPDNEFVGLLFHEGLGHFADLTCFEGTTAAEPSAYVDGPTVMRMDDPSVAFYSISWSDAKTRRSNAAPADFVTGYAEIADVYEDFAESVAYYFLQEESFQERAQNNPVLSKKLEWMRKHYPKPGPIAKGSQWNGQIPWDATKVAYEWITGN